MYLGRYAKDRDGKLNFTEFFEGMYNELEEHTVGLHSLPRGGGWDWLHGRYRLSSIAPCFDHTPLGVSLPGGVRSVRWPTKPAGID
jgi:hypothetical protein